MSLNGKRAISFSLLVLIALLVCLPAEAKKGIKTRKSKSRQIFFFDLTLNLTYDDNIINYSDADLDLYDEGVRSDKFAIESKDDWILIARIEPRIKGRFIANKTGWLALKFNNYHYVANNIRRYQKYGFAARQYLMRSGYAELEYSYIPDYYYRNQFVDAAYIESSFSKHFLKFEVGYDLIPSLKGDISYRYQRKFFNKEVNERDLKVNGVRLDAVWRASKKFKFWSYYGFERARAEGANDEDLDVRDVSYDAWNITLGSRFYSPYLPGLKPQLVASIQYRKIKFQTTKPEDIYRLGREDNNYQLRVGTSWLLAYDIRLDIDYKMKSKRTDLPEKSLESILEYDSNAISMKLKRSF